MKRFSNGVIQWIYMTNEGSDEEPIMVERVEDITRTVQRLQTDLEQANKANTALRKDLADFKNRGSWSETDIVQNERTGMAVVTRTEYRLRAEHMRVEFDPHNHPAIAGARTLAEEPRNG